MATQQAKSKPDHAPPPIEGDFYRIAPVPSDGERDYAPSYEAGLSGLHVRAFAGPRVVRTLKTSLPLIN